LGGLNPKPEVLWLEVENLVQLDSAYLAANDSTLDKPDIWSIVTGSSCSSSRSILSAIATVTFQARFSSSMSTVSGSILRVSMTNTAADKTSIFEVEEKHRGHISHLGFNLRRGITIVQSVQFGLLNQILATVARKRS
jgi:hypothetical protein